MSPSTVSLETMIYQIDKKKGAEVEDTKVEKIDMCFVETYLQTFM